MNILFTGYYGYKNTGDDAFVEVSSWGAKKFWGNPEIKFLAKTRDLPNTQVESKGFPISLPKTYRFQKQFLIDKADVLIAAGGSTLIREVSCFDPKMLALKKKERKGNIQIGGIGVSIGPFRSIKDENAVKGYLNKFDFLALRDKESYEYASSLHLPYDPINSFDLAALLPEVYDFTPIEKSSERTKIIGVSVCPYESLTGGEVIREKMRNKRTIKLLTLIEKNIKVHFKFFVINGHSKFGDYSLTIDTVREVAPRSFEIVNYNKNTKEIWDSIADCDFMLSTRLHGAIFACFAGVPFMLNEYHRKCGDFLDNIGYETSYRLYNSEYEVLEKAEQIMGILQNVAGYKSPERISEMKEMAKLNFTGIYL